MRLEHEGVRVLRRMALASGGSPLAPARLVIREGPMNATHRRSLRLYWLMVSCHFQPAGATRSVVLLRLTREGKEEFGEGKQNKAHDGKGRK